MIPDVPPLEVVAGVRCVSMSLANKLILFTPPPPPQKRKATPLVSFVLVRL